MSTKWKVSEGEYNQWVKFLKKRGYSGPFAGLTIKHEYVKLLAKELKRGTIPGTCPRDKRTIASNLTRYERGRGQPRLSEVEPKIDVDAIVLMPELERRHKTYILYKWRGLDIEEITKKLGISHESFWRDIEETEKEVGRVEPKELARAQDVSWLMSRFLSCLRTPDPLQILPVSTEQMELYETSWVEEQPLFPELKRLLGNEFCGKFNDWKKVRGQYFGKCISFLDTVRQNAERESQMKTTEYGEEWGLNDVFWQRIYSHVLLKTKLQPLNELDKGYLKNLDRTEFVIMGNDLVVKSESTVLVKGEPSQLDRVSKAYWSLVAGFTSTSEPRQIWALWQELGTIEKSLNTQAGAVYDEIISKWFRYRDTVVEI